MELQCKGPEVTCAWCGSPCQGDQQGGQCGRNGGSKSMKSRRLSQRKGMGVRPQNAFKNPGSQWGSVIPKGHPARLEISSVDTAGGGGPGI